jgi:hypothetical protein
MKCQCGEIELAFGQKVRVVNGIRHRLRDEGTDDYGAEDCEGFENVMDIELAMATSGYMRAKYARQMSD